MYVCLMPVVFSVMWIEAPRLMEAVKSVIERVEYTVSVSISDKKPISPLPRFIFMNMALQGSLVRRYNSDL